MNSTESHHKHFGRTIEIPTFIQKEHIIMDATRQMGLTLKFYE